MKRGKDDISNLIPDLYRNKIFCQFEDFLRRSIFIFALMAPLSLHCLATGSRVHTGLIYLTHRLRSLPISFQGIK